MDSFICTHRSWRSWIFNYIIHTVLIACNCTAQIGEDTRFYAFGPCNRLTGSGAATTSYDALGRLDTYVGTSGARYNERQRGGRQLSRLGTTIAIRFIRGPSVDKVLASYS